MKKSNLYPNSLIIDLSEIQGIDRENTIGHAVMETIKFFAICAFVIYVAWLTGHCSVWTAAIYHGNTLAY